MSSIAHVGHQRKAKARHVLPNIVSPELVDRIRTAFSDRFGKKRIILRPRLKIVTRGGLPFQIEELPDCPQRSRRERIRKRERICCEVAAAHRDHENPFAVLRYLRMRSGVEHARVPLRKPVSRLLNLGLNALKCSALVMGPKMPDVLQQQHPRLVGAEFFDQPD